MTYTCRGTTAALAIVCASPHARFSVTETPSTMNSTDSSALRSDALFGVQGLVAVVTGGGSGLGLIMARCLAENGAGRVYIVGRREANLKEAAASHPQTLVPLVGDVTSQASLASMAEHVAASSGHVDVVVANAGMAGPGLRGLGPRTTPAEFARSAWATPPADFDDVYRLNCTATYYTALAFLELLDAGNRRRAPGQPPSQVIAMGSMVAFQRDPRYGFAYLSSKAALVSMMKSLATYGASWGIRFNTIAAGLFPTEMSAAALLPFRIDKDKALVEEGAFAKSFVPAQRAGAPEDLAGALLYLASRAGAYVNGSVLLVDGGKIATVPATY